MKTLGLIGGMSWESSALYYQQINQIVKTRLGGLHSAKCLLHSVDFAQIADLQHQANWAALAKLLSDIAKQLEKAGAEGLIICTNTMHKVAEDVQQAISIPLVHIADATGQVLREQQIDKIALLGTAFTMSEDFYKGRLKERFGLEVLVPSEEQQSIVHKVIYQELCQGQIDTNSKQQYLSIIEDLAKQGAQGVILGCTEIGMLVKQTDTSMALFDTVKIHAEAAVDFALN